MSTRQTTIAKKHPRVAVRRSTKPIKIVLTGGGTGGHVIPTLATAAELQRLAPRVRLAYIGSETGVERELAKQAGIPYYAVPTGKLRRYWSLSNLLDALRIPLGVLAAVRLLRRLKPAVVLAKGGYVSVPVGLAAAVLRIPLVVHESDVTPGLAVRILARWATVVATSWPETAEYLPAGKTTLTGNPVRRSGNAARGLKWCGWSRKRKPTVLITGGSSGATGINQLVAGALPTLARHANLVWLTGVGKAVPVQNAHVRVVEYLEKEYGDVLAAADLVVSRAGAGALAELARDAKAAVLIPLPTAGSRGDQLKNAEILAAQGAVVVLAQETTNSQNLAKSVLKLLQDKKLRHKMGKTLGGYAKPKAAETLAKVILKAGSCAK